MCGKEGGLHAVAHFPTIDNDMLVLGKRQIYKLYYYIYILFVGQNCFQVSHYICQLLCIQYNICSYTVHLEFDVWPFFEEFFWDNFLLYDKSFTDLGKYCLGERILWIESCPFIFFTLYIILLYIIIINGVDINWTSSSYISTGEDMLSLFGALRLREILRFKIFIIFLLWRLSF
jgi:hypothetical protein